MQSHFTNRSVPRRRSLVALATLALVLIAAPWAAATSGADHCCCPKSRNNCALQIDVAAACCSLSSASTMPMARSTGDDQVSGRLPTLAPVAVLGMPRRYVTVTARRYGLVTVLNVEPIFARDAALLL